MKYLLEGINSKLEDAEEQSRRQGSGNHPNRRTKGKGIFLNEERLRDTRTTSSRQTFALYGSQKKREKGVENLFEEKIAENFPNLGKETDIQVQEAQGATKKMNLKRSKTRHIIRKMPKSKVREY